MEFLLIVGFVALFSRAASSACSNGGCKLLDSCSTPGDCGSGLYCGNCPATGRDQPVCTRGQATRVSAIVNDLPFNKYAWLTTHNSFSITTEPSYTGSQRVTFYNQEDAVTNQLNNGVRGFMLDMYDFMGDVWLCHSFGGQCYNITAFEPAINTLQEIESFLSSNPTEVVTIFIEDYVHAPKGLTRVFTDAGLMKYWFPVANMPNKGQDWPRISEMVSSNRRLIVFTSVASKEQSEGIAYQWRYLVENEPGDGGINQGSCRNRQESQPLKSKDASLFLMNFFPTIPDQTGSCKEHSGELVQMTNLCSRAAAARPPNFIAVNFYMRSDGGGVFDLLDSINGRSLCGCNTVTACQAGAANGVCKNVPAPFLNPSTVGSSTMNPTSPSMGSTTSSEPLQTIISSQSSCLRVFYSWNFYILLILWVLLVLHRSS